LSRKIPLNDDVMIAVDPHRASNTAEVLDRVTKTLTGTGPFANSSATRALFRFRADAINGANCRSRH
jgi:hypothetical protein